MIDVWARTDLFLAILLHHDPDGGEVILLLGVVVLHADELEIEHQVHAVPEKRLKNHRPRVVVLLLTYNAKPVREETE